MNRLWAAAVVCGLAAPAGAAVSPDPKGLEVPAHERSRAKELVRRLGGEVYRDREQAQAELAKMGRLARAALAEAVATDPNPEVRARAARLLPKAEAADLQARIETFLADAEGKFRHDLPGWAMVRDGVGADDPARKLYVEALKSPANLELLTALAASPEAAGRAIADRRMGLFLEMNPGAFGRIAPGGPTRARQPTLVDIALVLLAEAAVPNKDIPRPGPFVFITGAQFVQHQVAVAAVTNPAGTAHGEAYRRVFVRWLDTRTAPDDLNNIAHVANHQAFRSIKEVAALLRRVAATDGVASHAKAQAMIYLAQRGKDELPTIKSQLKNDAVLNQQMQIAPNVTINSQVRDVALALCLHFEGQDMKKFGFSTQQGINANQVIQNYWGYGFTSDEARAAAFKMWDEYEAKKGSEKPKDEPKK